MDTRRAGQRDRPLLFFVTLVLLASGGCSVGQGTPVGSLSGVSVAHTLLDTIESSEPSIVLVADARSQPTQRAIEDIRSSWPVRWQRRLLIAWVGLGRLEDGRGDALVEDEEEAVEFVSSIARSEVGRAYVAAASGQVYALTTPISSYKLTQSRRMIEEHSDLAEYRSTLVAVAEQRLRDLIVSREVPTAIAFFDTICDGCPSGEQFASILEDSGDAKKPWLVFVPRDYRNLIGSHSHPHVQLFPYSRDEEPFRELLFELSFFGFPLPMIIADEETNL